MPAKHNWSDEQLGQFVFDSVCEGQCQDKQCGEITECEPDATHNWCPSCDKQTVMSALVINHLI